MKTKSTSKFVLILALMAGFAVSGCQQESVKKPASPEPEPLVTLTDVQSKQKELALATRDKLFLSLLTELMTAMGEKGPAKSISVCKTRAPEIANSISQESGVRIGRTSFKLRNDANQPPQWATSFVQNKVAEEVYLELPDQGLGALLPIRLKATCTLCHGTNEQVTPDVKAAIVSNYPDDQATGFAEGDLRGYFWVEVPKPN